MEFLFKHVCIIFNIFTISNYQIKIKFYSNTILANRVSTMHDFGYVALNLKYVYPEDSGTYTCRAINDLGQAVTSATLNVHCEHYFKFIIN